MELEEIETFSVGPDETGVLIVQRFGEKVVLAISERSGGDAQLELDAKETEMLIEALKKALTFS